MSDIGLVRKIERTGPLPVCTVANSRSA